MTQDLPIPNAGAVLLFLATRIPGAVLPILATRILGAVLPTSTNGKNAGGDHPSRSPLFDQGHPARA